ncbi:MAG: exostosin domain-containing protein [Janthinobacterium lividum]
MFKIYTGSGYPLKFETAEVIVPISLNSVVVNQPEQADIFIFPVNYEKLYGYKEQDYKHYGYLPEEIEELKNTLSSMIALAKEYAKKIIIFYYFDPIEKIEIEDAIVFRTSLLKQTKAANEFAMPAYMKDLRKQKKISDNELWVAKTNNPTIGFRGQSAPLKQPAKLLVKRSINQILNFASVSKGFNLHYNFGYLARRDTLVSCIKNKNIKTDFTLTTPEQSWDPINGKMPFVNNIFNNQYNICVSGHGNYSFRLYEVLSAGRIPVFINTDCVLPFEEFIDWKKHVVWIEEKDAHKADQFLLDFHHSKHPDDFLELQKNNRLLWEKYLCKEGFYKSLHQYFPKF